MEFVCIEAKTFMEMNEALEAIVKKMCETCGSGISGMDDWIDNQEACMLMDVSPGKMLQLRRSRAIPYSYIDRKVYYKRQDIIRFMENSKRLLNYILCIRFFIEVHSIVSASRFFHMPTYLRVVIECQSRFFPFFPAFSRNCPDYFLHTSGSSSFRSLSDLGAR